jgi:hypothetical protein
MAGERLWDARVMASTGRKRSRVTEAEFAARLPGDALIGEPAVVLDRAATFDCSPAELWPWIVQLGKGRAGWYMPASIERFVPAKRRGAQQPLAQFQGLEEGDFVADWGPGFPLMQAVTVDREQAIVYLSLRDRARGHRWPVDEAERGAGVLAFSWALVIGDLGDGRSRLHIRLRVQSAGRLMSALGGPFDYITIQLLFAGLTERLAAAEGSERAY